MKRLKIFFDGGARPNPGRMEAAVVAGGRTWLFDDLGEGSSSEAEWLALIRAIEVARELGAETFELVGDSAEAVAGANGHRPKNAALAALKGRFETLAAATPPARIRRIARAQNLAGIALGHRRAAPSASP